MYSICITGHGKDKKVHEVFSNPFERSEYSCNIIAKMLDDLMSAPFYCIPDMMHINNDETGADLCFWFSFNECVEPLRVEVVRVATAWVEGWIARDMQQLCDDEPDDESDDESYDGECGDLASKYNELASAPFIIPGSENDNSRKRCKLFI